MQASRWAPQNDEDAFAQTREPDNFFDDDITPVSEPIVQPLPAAERPQHQFNQQGRGRGYNRGRGRGRGGNTDTLQRQDSSTPQSNGSKETDSSPAATSATKEPSSQSIEEATDSTSQDALSAEATETPSEASAPKVQAVRGPRHQTGGVQRPKLTEDELSARMAAAALNNAKREAAHREAEADAAKFEAREAAAKQRRVQETSLRRVMDTERERNRQRKLGAQGVREWDQGKDEGQTKSEQPRRTYHPGVHGGVVSVHRGVAPQNDAAGNTDDSGANGSYRGRGRGGRGGAQRGRGGSRGGFTGGSSAGSKDNIAAPSLGEEQFPALATNTTPSSDTQPPSTSTSLISPIVDKGTWADQVEASQ